MSEKNWNEWFLQRQSAKKAERKSRLLAEKQASHERGKEPFDLDRLQALYTPDVYDVYDAPREDRIRELEREYYLSHRDIMTLADFAKVLEKNDRFDGGEL